jgi:hypothetical protein
MALPRDAIVACLHARRQSEGASAMCQVSRDAGGLSLEKLQMHLQEQECRHGDQVWTPD